MTVTATMPESEGHRRYLDGWRGLAVSLVIFGHFLPVGFMNVGTFGVELFFVLSGLLMAEILFIKTTPLPVFFIRRINRVYPALFVFATTAFVASRFFPEFLMGPKPLLQALSFTFNYSIWIPGLYRTAFLDHIWSLCIEEHSYLLLAVILLLSRRLNFSVPAVLAAISLASFINAAISIWVLDLGYFLTYWRTDAHLGSIFVSAATYLWLRERRITVPPLVQMLCMAGGTLLHTKFVALPISYSLGTTLLAIGVCSLHQSYDRVRQVLSWRPLTAIGIVSYSLYLWQQPFYQLAGHGYINPFIGLAGAIACGCASFWLVERPSRSYLNRRFGQRSATASSGKTFATARPESP
jgi:peptidoglycan/LPS O-acetylase OafA/YrhL